MRFTVRELGKARADKDHIFKWIHARSRMGAVAWLNAYDSIVERLKSNADSCAKAHESRDLDMDVRQVLFKTRQGRIYRALFFIENVTVFVLRIRGPGQAPLTATDIGV